AANGTARGYRLHAVLNARGELAAFEVATLNVDERVVADANRVHAACDRAGALHRVTPDGSPPGAPGTARGRPAAGGAWTGGAGLTPDSATACSGTGRRSSGASPT
ncbi:MAG: hypothetical protein K2P78_02425, partial [Gemmataceae bacterium]|nr:hypothetical protein [Gemmataceae bacterium]